MRVAALWSAAFVFVAAGGEETCRSEGATSCGRLFAADPGNARFRADRLLAAAVGAAAGCRGDDVDAAAPGFEGRVLEAFARCRVVVVRNATRFDHAAAYAARFDAYVGALRRGGVGGATTHGERYLLSGIGDARWLLLLPEAFATPEVVAPPWLTAVLAALLGPSFRLNDLGAAVAEAGAAPQEFHLDDGYFLGSAGLRSEALGGHDLC